MWKDILKADKWFIKTDSFTSTLPQNLIDRISKKYGEDNLVDKLAEAYENGLLINLQDNTHYTIEKGKVVSIDQHRSNRE